MMDALVVVMPTIVVLLYVCAQLVAEFAAKRMYFSETFLPELVVYFVFVIVYVFAFRSFKEKRYFAASVAGAIIGIVIFVIAAFWLVIGFDLPRDLSI